MSKKVNQTLTGAMAAMMATGVVATPVMAATTDVDALYKAAYTATQKALTEKTQASVNEARKAIKALPANLDWAIGEFSKKVDSVQHPILVNIVEAIKLAEKTPTQANINAAKKAIPADLVPAFKNSYSSAVDKIQQGLQAKVVEAVKKAETSRKADDVEAAKKLIADVATADSQALKDWAKAMQNKVEAVKLYDLDVTKATLLEDGSGVEVEFKALPEAIRNVNLEVINNNGKTVEVELADVLIEGETTYTFTFKNALKSEDLKGNWTINGLVVKQDEVNLVNYVLGIVSGSDSQTVFTKLQKSGLIKNLVDKVANHNQYVAVLADYVLDEKIKTVSDIQEAIDKANKEIGTDVKVSDVVERTDTDKYTLGQFTELFNKLNLDRVNSEWIKDYRTNIGDPTQVGLGAAENKTVSDIQSIIDKTNEKVAVKVFTGNAINEAQFTDDTELATNSVVDAKKINKYIKYVTDYVVVKENDKTAADNKEAKLKSLNVALAVANVNKADTVTSLKNALQNLSTIVNDKSVFSYDEHVNESLLTAYVKSDLNTKKFNKASEVKLFVTGVNKAEITKAKGNLSDTAVAYAGDVENSTKKAAFVDALAKLETVTAKEAKAERFDDSIINADLLEGYAKAIKTIGDKAAVQGKKVSEITTVLKGVVTNLVTDLFKTEELAKDTTADLFLKRLNNQSLGLTNVVDANKAAYFADKALFVGLTSKDQVVNKVNVVNALVAIKNASDITTVKNALTTISVLQEDFGYINRTDASKQDVAELLLDKLTDEDATLELANVAAVVSEIKTNINVELNNLLNEAAKGINKTKDDAAATKDILEKISPEYKAITNIVTKIEIAQSFNANRPYTLAEDKITKVYTDFVDLTEVRTLLASVMK